MRRAMVFHASTKGRVKQFGACHYGGAIIFYAKMLGSRSQSTIPLYSQSFFCKYNMEHILYLMSVEYKHGFLMTLLGLMSRSSPDSNKQYIVKKECKIYLFND